MAAITIADVAIPMTAQDRIRRAIHTLPTLAAKDVNLDDSCAICLNGFASILDEEHENAVQEDPGEDRDSASELGITRLVGCGHLFCRKDLLEWIRGFHGSCPTCRHIFLEIRPPSDSDGESSDGDYFPNEEEDEEEDDFIIESDPDADFDFEVDEMDLGLDLGEIWDDSGMDAEEESWADEETTYSEADTSLTGELDALAEDAADDTLCGVDEDSDDK